MTVEVIYFQKPCPHCKEPLFRVHKMYLEWSECRNKACPYLTSQVPMVKSVRGVEIESDPEPFTCIFNRR